MYVLLETAVGVCDSVPVIVVQSINVWYVSSVVTCTCLSRLSRGVFRKLMQIAIYVLSRG